MEKQVKVKAYTRKSRSGKRVVVKSHTSRRKAGTGGKTKMKKEYVERLARKSAYPGMALDVHEEMEQTGLSHKEALQDAHDWNKRRSKDEMTTREYREYYQKQYGKKPKKASHKGGGVIGKVNSSSRSVPPGSPKKRGCCK